jgi:alpha-glucosidase
MLNKNVLFNRTTRQESDANDIPWWQRAVFYEIAVLSFQDSNGDGKGDLAGLINRVDYLEWLGVTAIWLTPIYHSPMLDLGYDVTDFCTIDSAFGTMQDFDRLLALLHARGMHLILDFVPNHTSKAHAWFQDSRAARASLKRQWYVWADAGSDGGPPNNWLSRFGGSAWEWDEQSKQYYYHAFLPEQPDLNWRNPEVREAMADVLRFWLRRGVDGFRVDASAVLIEDALLRDDPVNPAADINTPPPQRLTRIFTDDRPESMACLEELRRVVDEFDDRVLAGEVQGKTDRIGHFYGEGRPRLHLPLNFTLLDSAWDALSLQAQIDAYLNAIPHGAWPDWVIGGHDKRRVASNIGQEQARILAMLMLTLRGTPFFFAGDELGMEQIPIPPSKVQDPFEKRVPGYGLNRDPQRSPMRWDDSPAAGFTSGEPWMPMGDHWADRTVAKLQADERSLLWLYRRLLILRAQEPTLVTGEYLPLRSHHDVLTYKRIGKGQEILVALNTKHQPRRLAWQGKGMLLLTSYLDKIGQDIAGPRVLRADEGIIVKLLPQ